MNKPFYMYMNVQGMGRNVFTCLITIFLLASCQSYKKVPYLQDVEVVEQTAQQENLYDAKIMPKDLLTIVVSCTSPELAVPFNLTVASPVSVATGNTQLTTQPVLQPYLVDNEGKINFPVLGELKVGGLTKKEAEQLIIEKLKPYIKETPIVTVWGLRDNVKLIREGADGKQQIITLDLNSAETILSPYYWLQQNDIVYVTPNKAKARNSDIGNSTSLWFSATSILVSLASLLVTIFK